MMQFLKKMANPKVIGCFLLLFTFFALYLFPKYGAGYQYNGFNILDLRLSYTKDDVLSLFNHFGTTGRDNYHFIASVIDMIFPIICGILNVLTFVFIIKIIAPSKSWLYYLIIIPIAAMCFDYLENFNTLQMLCDFPNISELSAQKGSFYTSSKWCLVFITLGLMGIGFLIMFINKLQKK